jgi:3-dehydroquinate synthase
MVDILVHNTLAIDSHKGKYEVIFDSSIPQNIDRFLSLSNCCYIVDKKIAKLYESNLASILEKKSTFLVDVDEKAKSLEKLPPLVEHLTLNAVRRDTTFVAIGGGVVQDITCFISSIFLRGIPWVYIPTTLLSQADSCIGSKSSINTESAKNILGTFYPPKKVYIWPEFLRTLTNSEIRSGVGEILKVCAIDGIESFGALTVELQELYCNQETLLDYIRKSLEIKKKYIELDEFDRGPRNIFNYGHSFGHAIEFAANYSIPHGVAVTIGMDLANFISGKLGYTSIDHFRRMHPALVENAGHFWGLPFPIDSFFEALLRDKKNTQTELGLVLPTGSDAKIERVNVQMSPTFKSLCVDYYESIYGSSD